MNIIKRIKGYFLTTKKNENPLVEEKMVEKLNATEMEILSAKGNILRCEEGKDFLNFEPLEQYDAIVTNPPFSIKNKIFERCIKLDKPFCLLMSATSIQSASFIEILSKAKEFNVMMFNRRISYNGDRPAFPSWYYSGGFF